MGLFQRDEGRLAYPQNVSSFPSKDGQNKKGQGWAYITVGKPSSHHEALFQNRSGISKFALEAELYPVGFVQQIAQEDDITLTHVR
jgi:hypothetical protein